MWKTKRKVNRDSSLGQAKYQKGTNLSGTTLVVSGVIKNNFSLGWEDAKGTSWFYYTVLLLLFHRNIVSAQF